MKKLIIVGNPVPADWEFSRGIEAATQEKWEVLQCVTNRYGGISKFTRYIKYFMIPISVFFRRKKYSDILSRDQFFGIVLAFYFRLFHIKKAPMLHIMTFIYKPKKRLIGKVYEKFVRYAVTSEYIKNIFVFGKSEINYYAVLFGLPKELFTVETLGIKDSGMFFPQVEENMPAVYYAAAGRSNRDYDFLRKTWPEDEDNIYIISDMEKADNNKNIYYKKNCFGDVYLGVLANAKAIIVPLEDERISSGQLVVLHAAMLGKPVIVTYNETAVDYVEDGKSGFIIEKSSQALKKALEELDNLATYEKMSRYSRKKFEENFSLYQLGKRMGNKIKAQQF